MLTRQHLISVARKATQQGIITLDSSNVTNDGKIMGVDAGQSNMEGRDGDTSNIDYPFPVTNGFYFDGTNESQLTTDRGGASGGSHSNYFAEKFIELTNNQYKPVILEEAYGGTGMVDNSTPNWGSGSTLRGNVESKVSSALSFYNLQSPLWVLWAQGERDAQSFTEAYGKAEAKAAMNDILDWWFGLYPNTLFLISELGALNDGSDGDDWEAIREVHQEVAQEREKVILASTAAKTFPSLGYMSDNIHYDYRGYKVMGEDFATSLVENVQF